MLEYLKKIMVNAENSFDRRLSILVIEDSKMYSMVLKKYLINSLLDIDILPNVKLTETGEEAIEYMKTNRPDIILMDFSLGGHSIDGLDLIKNIRVLNNSATLMVLTHSCNIDIANECYRFGANNYIHKERDSFKAVIKYITKLIDYNDKKNHLNF
tara:strand:+ start:201 stop:668 length:468 start_codon:yes stop_codon:yes gene_type:complete